MIVTFEIVRLSRKQGKQREDALDMGLHMSKHNVISTPHTLREELQRMNSQTSNIEGLT